MVGRRPQGVAVMHEPETFARPRQGESFEDFQARYRASVPPVLYLPVARATGEGEPVEIEMRTTADGRTALLAYSAYDRLIDGCGPHQPYALVPTANLEELKAQRSYDVVYFDLVIPDQLRHTESGPAEVEPAGQVEEPAGPGRRNA